MDYVHDVILTFCWVPKETSQKDLRMGSLWLNLQFTILTYTTFSKFSFLCSITALSVRMHRYSLWENITWIFNDWSDQGWIQMNPLLFPLHHLPKYLDELSKQLINMYYLWQLKNQVIFDKPEHPIVYAPGLCGTSFGAQEWGKCLHLHLWGCGMWCKWDCCT